MNKHSSAKSGRFKSSRQSDHNVQPRNNASVRRRQLFDPAVDNPIDFNKLTVSKSRNTLLSPGVSDNSPDFQVRRPYKVEAISDDGMDFVPRGPSTGRLWQADASTVAPNITSTRTRMQSTNDEKKPVDITDEGKKEDHPLKISSCNASAIKSCKPDTDPRKSKIKSFFNDIQQIEKNIAKLNQTSATLALFRSATESELDEGSFRRQDMFRNTMVDIQQLQLDDSDLTAAVSFLRDKTKLHLDLAYKYLDIMRVDYDFSERKNLETLCWKRAIYSMFDQFRCALKLWSPGISSLEIDTDEQLEKPIRIISNMPQRRVIAMLIELCDEFLCHADYFYRDVMMFLYNLDKMQTVCNENDDGFNDWMDEHLLAWRRTKRLKWYRSIPFRGDIARYRWAITTGYGFASQDTQDLWEVAWHWYSLGTFFMPTTGRLYFNLSLLLNKPISEMPADYSRDLHKLYFGIRSLMVRRNSFVNAREDIIVLFERNRQAVNRYLQTLRAKGACDEDFDGQSEQSRSTKTAVDLLIRLHGMLFTKIGLDQFAEIRRRLFEMLFSTKEKQQHPEKSSSREMEPNDTVSVGCEQLTRTETFWMEVAVLSISSLYNYNYASAALTKVLTLHNRRLFPLDAAVGNDGDGKNSESKADAANTLIQEVSENILIAHGAELLCQIATELFKCYCGSSSFKSKRPLAFCTSALPKMPSNFTEHSGFIFGQKDSTKSKLKLTDGDEMPGNDRRETWLVFIELLLQWMVCTCICVPPTSSESSLWEKLFGLATADEETDTSTVSPAFWYELLAFLNRLLWSVSEDKRYEIINKHLLPEQDLWERIGTPQPESMITEYWLNLMSQGPTLPEELPLRGLGWIDEITSKMSQGLDNAVKKGSEVSKEEDLLERRKLKILDYGFALVMQMRHIFTYDPVMEQFSINTDQTGKKSAAADEHTISREVAEPESEYDETYIQGHLGSTFLAMDDDVLLAEKTDSLEEPEDDDIVTQLKKRREHLQTMLTVTGQEEHGREYKRSYGRAKEREARMKSLRERVIPGDTVLVLDTNCFIGQLELVKKLIESDKWPIVIPLVVITELDGLSSNAAPLGTIANDALQFIDAALNQRARRNSSLRIQTSHNNFLNDISIRYEQFIFGEMDKNLDDLVLSVCLWWSSKQSNDKRASVCLVTGDRNLSVKARAREIDVMSVTAVMQITPRTKAK